MVCVCNGRLINVSMWPCNELVTWAEAALADPCSSEYEEAGMYEWTDIELNQHSLVNGK